MKSCKENQTEYYPTSRATVDKFHKLPEIVRIPAYKGTAIVCENEKEYIQKEDELLRDMDVERSNKTEKQLIQRAHKRLIEEFKKMKMKWQEYRK